VLEDLVREVTALWQTDELRRQKPTPVDGKGGRHTARGAHGDMHVQQELSIIIIHSWVWLSCGMDRS
jgi:hypothetical protein